MRLRWRFGGCAFGITRGQIDESPDVDPIVGLASRLARTALFLMSYFRKMAVEMTHTPNSLPCCCRTAGDERENLRRAVGQVSGPARAQPEILSEPINLVHPFMQYRHDADVAIGQLPPVDEMLLVVEEKPIDAEFGRNGFRGDAMRGDPVEGGKQSGDVAVGLFGPPPIPRVTVDVVQAQRRTCLNADPSHPVRSGCGL